MRLGSMKTTMAAAGLFACLVSSAVVKVTAQQAPAAQ